jgi:hypothetical protein
MSIYHVFDERGSRQIVGPEIAFFVEEVSPLLYEALQYSRGEMSVEDALAFVAEGFCQLWIGGDKDKRIVILTEIADFPQKRVVRIVALAGETAHYISMFEAIKRWAAMNGASELEAYCRPSVARLAKRYGFFRTEREQIVLSLKGYMQ